MYRGVRYSQTVCHPVVGGSGADHEEVLELGVGKGRRTQRDPSVLYSYGKQTSHSDETGFRLEQAGVHLFDSRHIGEKPGEEGFAIVAITTEIGEQEGEHASKGAIAVECRGPFEGDTSCGQPGQHDPMGDGQPFE
jgi:hypothetical protein